jgi:hypothetical protein
VVQVDLLEVLYRCCTAGPIPARVGASFPPGFLGALEELAAESKSSVNLGEGLRRLLVLYNNAMGVRARCAVLCCAALRCAVL